ncbi:DUF2332 domain-containing protein [Peribacillus sp. NPDC056705]|uniref:DUF2332 domain-containing protein n=1 Tax=Peribacillus sp. NPDC056705 TaxID=3345918 RepID=UPI003749087E
MDMERLANVFSHFAERECNGSSDLYEFLAGEIAGDEEVLQVAGWASPGQPIPNLLFGAVQYLLLQGKGERLQAYYPGLVEQPLDIRASYTCFRTFVLQHREEIISILQSKRVQTNEVRRCAYLYPVFCSIYDKMQRPLALIELGTSAGLQLLWDQYGYAYGQNERYGGADSKVLLQSEIRGHQPLLLPQSPPVVYRMGVDLHVNDVRHPEDYLWLRSLIWPGHHDRVATFEHAVDALKLQSDVQFMEGDGTVLLPDIAAEIPEEAVICVFHTHVANQMPEESKRRLLHHLEEISRRRDVMHVYNNMWDGDLHIDYYAGGKSSGQTVARTDGHARWFEWLGETRN